MPVDPTGVRQTLAESGIVNSVIAGIGHTQLRGPVHDSFADYFAGRAHADLLVPLPDALAEADEQRLIFTAEMTQLPQEAYLSVARALPFTLVRVSIYDNRDLGDDTPQQVADLLARVVPDAALHKVRMWRVGARVLAQAGAVRIGWVPAEEGQAAMYTLPTIVCEDHDGAAAIAVRLWRRILNDRLRAPAALRRPRPSSLAKARRQLEEHATATLEATRDLIAATAPSQALNRLSDAVGPLGMAATITEGSPSFRRRGPGWLVAYDRAPSVRIGIQPPTPGNESADHQAWPGHPGRGRTDFDAITMTSPAATAAKNVRAAINTLTKPHWL